MRFASSDCLVVPAGGCAPWPGRRALRIMRTWCIAESVPCLSGLEVSQDGEVFGAVGGGAGQCLCRSVSNGKSRQDKAGHEDFHDHS